MLRDGRIAAVYRKQQLPNYTVFHEERYFEPGAAPCVFEVEGLRVGVVICEDIWYPGPAAQERAAGAEVLVVPNGSPWHTRQHALRLAQVSARARENAMPVVYVNRVGGQDELVFDGASFVVDARGELTHQLPAFEEALGFVDVVDGAPVKGEIVSPLAAFLTHAALEAGEHQAQAGDELTRQPIE